MQFSCVSKALKILCYYFRKDDDLNLSAWHYHWENELRHAGHTMVVVNPLKELEDAQSRSRYDEFIVERVQKENAGRKIDIFFSFVMGNKMSAEAVLCIRELGIKTVNFTSDPLPVAHRYKRIAKAFDMCWVCEPEAINTIKSYGARVFHAPVAANPYTCHPSVSTEDVNVSFCGQPREGRFFYVTELFRRGIPVELYGVGWKHLENAANASARRRQLTFLQKLSHLRASLSHKHGRILMTTALIRRLRRRKLPLDIQTHIEMHAHGPLSFPDMVRLFSRSKLSLGFNEVGHTYLLKKPLLAVRLRDFEAPMSGACHIMYRVPIMQEQFEENKEMLFYSSVDELVDKIRYWLDSRRDTERKKIKERARKRALREHTWSHRFSKLFEELELCC
ncbi:MAG: glycosyltransferase [Chloroflexota bacterium]